VNDDKVRQRIQELEQAGVIKNEGDLWPGAEAVLAAASDAEFEAILSLRWKMGGKQRGQFDRTLLVAF